MFARTLTTALVSAALLTGAFQSNAFADMGGGNGGGGYEAPFPSASARRADGSTISSQGNRDGSRIVTERGANGKIVRQVRVGGKKQKNQKKPKKPGRPWASAYDPATNTRTTSVGNGNGTRTVFSIGPFGISIGISR